MTEQIDQANLQSTINSIAWKACDTFRGVVDPSEYKNFILVMLFLKYISDVWLDHYDELKEQFGDDEERIRRKLDRERFVLPKGADFYSIYKQRNADNLGEIINQALDAVEEANKAKLEGVFRNIDYNSDDKLGEPKERNTRLRHLLEDFADERMNLRPSRIRSNDGSGNNDIIGDTYEYLIENFAAGAGKKGGEFYTPKQVGWLLAKLARPQPGDRICDPACGSGSLLIKAGMEVGGKDFSLYGHESNGDTWALAKMNMFLHGMDGARIERCNTFSNPKLLEGDRLMKFNVVVANPPFSLDKWGAEEAGDDPYRRFHRGIPPKSKGDYAFISHMVEVATATDGRVVVIAPHGVLFRGGQEGKIRQAFIEENLLDTVIGLPPALFYGTGIPVSILVFKKGRTDTDVLFIDASREFDAGKRQNRLLDENIDHIAATFRNRTVEDKYSYLAARDEIKENDYNLNIPRYVDTFEEEAEIDIQAVQREIVDLEGQLTQVRQEMDGYLKELGL